MGIKSSDKLGNFDAITMLYAPGGLHAFRVNFYSFSYAVLARPARVPACTL